MSEIERDLRKSGYALRCNRCTWLTFYVRDDYERHMMNHNLEDIASILRQIAEALATLPTAEDLTRILKK